MATSTISAPIPAVPKMTLSQRIRFHRSVTLEGGFYNSDGDAKRIYKEHMEIRMYLTVKAGEQPTVILVDPEELKKVRKNIDEVLEDCEIRYYKKVRVTPLGEIIEQHQ